MESFPSQWRQLTGPEHAYHFYSYFTREENLERGERVYLHPHTSSILLEQVNGKRAFPHLFFVLHEMFPSRIESLCENTFARCVIRSPLLLVKESPRVAIAFSRCKGTYISKGVLLIILYTGYFGVYHSYCWFYGFLQIQFYIFVIECSVLFFTFSWDWKNISNFLFYSLQHYVILTIQYLSGSKCEHINYICCRTLNCCFPVWPQCS